MTLPVARDEELGKKDDDYHPRAKLSALSIHLGGSRPHHFRRKRTLILIVGLVIVYNVLALLFPGRRSNENAGVWRSMATSEPGDIPAFVDPPVGPPPYDSEDAQSRSDIRYFNGPIKYYDLATSLRKIPARTGRRDINKNILFAASDLQSASIMVTLACEMSKWRRNYVHFALMSREDISLDDFKEINGVTDECKVWWHDARPDYSQWSTDSRMGLAVSAALNHINAFMHPQAIIINHEFSENPVFIKSVHSKAQALGKTVIQIPKDGVEKLLWITRLDSASLRAWHEVSVEVLIHAPTDSSGSLIRLLKSIQNADYFGSTYPKLTIELPPFVDPPIRQFLETMTWPPDSGSLSGDNQLSLHHRISHEVLSPTEASVRFIESFYPADPSKHHVLLLSPQAELSPLYFHYLKYYLLEYGFSTASDLNLQTLLGISLEFPTTQLDGKTPLNIPTQVVKNQTYTALRWEAPNSNAALYFGDKWTELHSFLGDRLAARHINLPLDQRAPKRAKLVSEQYPAWMEYVFEFMRARGYSMLYPKTQELALVSIHNELYQIPEEFRSRDSVDASVTEQSISDSDEPFVAEVPSTQPIEHVEPPLLQTSLFSFLSSDARPMSVESIPLISYAGSPISRAESAKLASKFKQEFMKEIGGCSGQKLKTLQKPLSATDLFCLDDEEIEEETEFKILEIEKVTSSTASPEAIASSVLVDSPER